MRVGISTINLHTPPSFILPKRSFDLMRLMSASCIVHHIVLILAYITFYSAISLPTYLSATSIMSDSGSEKSASKAEEGLPQIQPDVPQIQ